MYLFFYIDSPEHLHQKSLGVLQELLDLKIGFELVELLHLGRIEGGQDDALPWLRHFEHSLHPGLRSIA